MAKKKTKTYYFDTMKGREIAKYFFIEFTNQTEVSKKIYPNLIKGKGREKSWSIPYVNKLFQIWSNKGFFEEKIEYQKRKNKAGKFSKYPLKKYRLNLNPFFEEFEKRKHIKIPVETKRFIELCFDIPFYRELIRFMVKEDIFTFFDETIKTFFALIWFKDQTLIKIKKEKPSYQEALLNFKKDIQNIFFSKSKKSSKIKEKIINQLDKIFDGEKSKEILYVYFFMDCDSDNQDIWLSLIKIFTDKFTQALYDNYLLNKKEKIMEELTKFYGSKYIQKEVIREEISTKFRKFIFWYFKQKSMLDKKEIKEVIKELEKINKKDFDKIKTNYIKRKIDFLLDQDKKLEYALEKLSDKNLKKQKELEKESQEEKELNKLQPPLYPASGKEYIKRWLDLFRNVKKSNLINNLKEIESFNKILRDSL